MRSRCSRRARSTRCRRRWSEAAPEPAATSGSSSMLLRPTAVPTRLGSERGTRASRRMRRACSRREADGSVQAARPPARVPARSEASTSCQAFTVGIERPKGRHYARRGPQNYSESSPLSPAIVVRHEILRSRALTAERITPSNIRLTRLKCDFCPANRLMCTTRLPYVRPTRAARGLPR